METNAHELENLLELRTEKLWQVVGEIIALLSEDIPGYMVKQTKVAFLGHVERAETMSVAAVKELKQDAVRIGSELAGSVSTKLSERAVWLAAPTEVDDIRSLAAASEVWSIVGEVETALGSLLRSCDLLGPEEAVSAYKAPMYFVGGRYFPSLSEHFWKLLKEIRELEQRKVHAQSSVTRDGLLAKWDAE